MNPMRSYLKCSMKIIVFIALILLCTATTVLSQKLEINWTEGPNTVTLGDEIAQLTFGEDYLFANGDDTRKAMESIGNPPSNREVGMIIPKKSELNWFVVFDYFPAGYIRDEDKDKIDADAILKSLKEGTEESNKFRKERGIPPIHLTGWYSEPYYDTLTNNLTWATLLLSEGDEEGNEGVNHNIRLLGRYGYMSLVLVADRSSFASFKPEIDKLVSNLSFKKGKSYAEYVKGDKVAKYGLTALIAGGAATVAAKTGLLKTIGKFIKFIIIGVIAILAALKNKIKALFTRSGKTDVTKT